MQSKGRISKLQGMIISIASVASVILLWGLITDVTGWVKPLYFPSPGDVIRTAGNMSIQLLYHSAATIGRVTGSWLIGAVLGVLIGLIIYSNKVLYSILNPLIEALRPVPPVALIPLVLVWFGIGDFGKIFIATLACFMILVVNTVVACGNVPPVYLQEAKTLGASPQKAYTRVFLPAIIPEIISGARIAIATCFGVTVACEYMGAQYGVGYLIMQASRTLNTSVVVLGTFVIGVEAFLLERILHLISKRITRWKE